MSTPPSLAGSPPSLSDNLSSRSPPRNIASDPLSTGLRTLFDPTIRQTTEKLWVVHQSQIALAEELERLISRKHPPIPHKNHTITNKNNRIKPLPRNHRPPLLKPTIVKLASVGKRLNAVNAQLHTIQARVSRLFIQLSKQKAINNPNNQSTTPGLSGVISSSPAAAALAAAAAGLGGSGSGRSGG
ncbi:hypothetical protein TWF481_001816 [Arthrobotrys musiformis]|uniref:Biogenesis of lysosome-related organelles complex 1 subunit 7 n=1 Tax=Arthrobotrys musiformis TaxID=47236 RepID=A0AAV9VVP4_9PEZI